MSYTFGKNSRRKVGQGSEELQRLLWAAIEHKECPFDFTVLCVHRNEKDQNAAFNSGHSTLKWPYSKHNMEPSDAADLARFYNNSPHVRWGNLNDFKTLMKHMKKVAKEQSIDIECGMDWKEFKDYPHLQIVREENG